MSTNLHISTLTCIENARHYFAHFSQIPWAMLLDSGNSLHPDSHFDIIVTDPVATLTTRGLTTSINYRKANTTEQSTADPLALIARVLSEVFDDDTPCDLPFSGGALGYFSYDLGRRFEDILTDAEDDLELPEMAIGIYDYALVFDNKTNIVNLVSRGSIERHNELLAQITIKIKDVSSTKFALTSPWHHQIDQIQYNKGFSAIQDYLRAGDCYQINYTQRFSADYRGCEYQAYLELCHHNEMPFSGYLKLEHGAILSISPERFIQCNAGNVEAKPIKGTRPRKHERAIDQKMIHELRNSEKDQAENLMIVDLLRNDIGRCAKPGSVDVPQLFAIESFPGVHHLVSTVTAKLCEHKTPFDLLRGAFPGGSITGAPKVRAMNIIDELEPQRRTIYCGSIGYISADKKMDTNITIRTLLCLNGKVYCWAGGGIVADSNASDEYQECFDKVAKILPVLEKL